MNLTKIMENNSRLFSHVIIPRRSAPTKIRPILPLKIKFLTKPNSKQILYSGLYFCIPDNLLFYEMDLLEKAIISRLPDISQPLNIPYSLVTKLDPSFYGYINGFHVEDNKAYIESANCLFVNPDSPLLPTSLEDPAYGVLLPLYEASACLSYLLASISLYRAGDFDTLPTMLEKTWSKVEKASGVNMTKASFIDGMFRIGPDLFGNSIEDDCVAPGLAHLLGSFLSLDTDVSKHLEW